MIEPLRKTLIKISRETCVLCEIRQQSSLHSQSHVVECFVLRSLALVIWKAFSRRRVVVALEISRG